MVSMEVFPVGVYGANCTLLWQDPQAAWLFDPGADAADILDVLRQRNLTLAVIVLTHAHFDHISAVNAILEHHPVPVYLHAQDVEMAFSTLNASPPYPLTQRPQGLNSSHKDGEQLNFGGLSATVLHTPGHTPGGCCFYFAAEELLVAGDTLFAGSVGRTDFPGGSWDTLQKSLAKLKQLPDATSVVCGHGPLTTIGAEKATNPYLQ